MNTSISFELSKEYLERFKQALQARDHTFIQNSLAGVNPADISELLEEFDGEASKYVITLLDKSIGAEIIVNLDEDTQARFLTHFTSEATADYVDEMDSDDGVDVIHTLPSQKREEVIALLQDEEKARHLLDLLRYDEDVAGGLMAKEMIRANLNWTIQQCIEEIRKQAEKVEKIYSVYVVDNEGKLLGRVSLKKIILTENAAHVADIYDSDTVSVETTMQAEEVTLTMQKYNLDALPVVNVKGKLVGRITIDDAIDVMTEQADEDRQMMSGIAGDVEDDDSVWVLSKARLPWLIIGLAGGLLGAQFISWFEEDIILIPAMAFFIPLITATGGNVGIQSSAIVVQRLANPNAFHDSVLRKMLKVFLVALINGLALALLVLSVLMLFTTNPTLSFTVSAALFSVVLLASFMGTITPLVFHKIGINPAMASGPFITTANDLLGLTIYFLIAHLLYGF